MLLFFVLPIFDSTICFANSTGITEIDLTEIATGNAIEHEHIYEQKYDDTKHWQECFICRSRQNEKNHVIQKVGYEGCDPFKKMGYQYCSDNCGYQKQFIRQKCVKGTEVIDGDSGKFHLYRCINCNQFWGNGTMELHYIFDTNGKKIYVTDIGHQIFTCAGCGMTIDNSKHLTIGNYYENEQNCYFCGEYPTPNITKFVEKDVFDFTDANNIWKEFEVEISYIPDYKNVKIFSIQYLLATAEGHENDFACEYTITNQTETKLTIQGRLKFLNEYRREGYEAQAFLFGITYENEKCKCGWSNLYYSATLDKTPPKVIGIPIIEGGTNWSKSKKIAVNLKETYSNQVIVSLYDGNTEIEGSDGLAINNGDGTWTRIFDSVGEVKGAKTLRIKAKDGSGNESFYDFNISNIDNKAPQLVNTTQYLSPWRKEQIITFEATDNGIGEVSIAFNDKSDYQKATYNSNTGKWERTYQFTGNVGNEITGALYLKDGLDNENMVKIYFNQLDKTIPNITTTVTDFKVTATITDNLSGVNGYAITKSANEPAENEWQVINATLTENNQTTTQTKGLPDGIYYYWVKDQAGNTASSEFEITTTPFITKWEISTPDTIKLPIPSNSENDYVVDWGDGSSNDYNSTANFPSHTYITADTYTIKISGKVNYFGYTNTVYPTQSNVVQEYYTFTQYLVALEDWGEIESTRYGFSNCGNLKSNIPIPREKSFTRIIDMSNLFYNCNQLKGINPGTSLEINSETNIEVNMEAIPETLFQTATNVTNFQNVFFGCSELKGKIPENLFVNCLKVSNFAGSFQNCKGLSGEILENIFAQNKNVTTFANTFSGCSNLTGMIPAKLFENHSKATNYEGTFRNCMELTAGELQINTTNVTNMNEMFSGCTNLESIVFGKEFKNLNGNNMFQNCENLRAIILLSNVQTIAEVGEIIDITTLGLANNTILYVPYKTTESIYEQAWSNIPAERIEQVIKAVEPNPDYVGLNQEYIDPGYTVAGFTMDEAEKYTQYGFYVEIKGAPVETSTTGSKWIEYILKRK